VRSDLTNAVTKVYPDLSAAPVEIVVEYGHPAAVLISESEHAD